MWGSEEAIFSADTVVPASGRVETQAREVWFQTSVPLCFLSPNWLAAGGEAFQEEERR